MVASSKNLFIGYNVLKFGLYDAVLIYNKGLISRINVLRHLGLKDSINTRTGLQNLDAVRLKKADYAMEEIIKAAWERDRRRKKRKKKKMPMIIQINLNMAHGFINL